VLEHGTRGRHFSLFWQRFRPKTPSTANFLLWVPLFPECCTRGRRLSPSVTLPRMPWVLRHSGKPLFPECISSPSATLGKDWLPRVPNFWHSGRFRFSRSVNFG
jgi:hypothetical protein